MKVEYLGKKQGRIGIKVIDEKSSVHKVEIGLDGEIVFHGNDDYPYQPEERSEEEQRIMSQVEERAKYAAQQEFPEEDILEPMWDPEHIKRGIEALKAYQLDDFHREFRDYYKALQDPAKYASDPRESVVVESARIYKAFTITPDNRIDEIDDVALSYECQDGSDGSAGRVREMDDSLIVCAMPALDIGESFDYEDEFHKLVLTHLVAQIRDIYLDMGEEPPDEYKVQGVGKLNIHGDGIGET
ncbi:hypothetical protein HISP_16105 [Haloarcula hispanica N601]|uniref:Uncharacterized protein n=3 Tax=Haloarcula hispanica TaxID=51589 RepID=V5TR63_HALHI|nr:conserved hypothetical protein [Haloarcula hispanica ATCC 33960]AHB67593.1 hypothetical protein HISP_16105 [Haloarcula hispanica N601]